MQVAAGVQQLAHLAQARDEVVDLRPQRDAVRAVDLLPQRRVGARDARRVAKARPGRGRRLAPERCGGLRDEQVRDDVRQVRDRGHEAVVLGRPDRGRHRAEAGDEPREALVEHAGRALGRGEVPRRAVEEVLARMRDAGRLGPRERMPADEVRPVDGIDERLLRRADIAHDGARAADRTTGARRPAARRRRRKRSRRRPRRGRRCSPRPRRSHRCAAPSRAPPGCGSSRRRGRRGAGVRRARSSRR